MKDLSFLNHLDPGHCVEAREDQHKRYAQDGDVVVLECVVLHDVA